MKTSKSNTSLEKKGIIVKKVIGPKETFRILAVLLIIAAFLTYVLVNQPKSVSLSQMLNMIKQQNVEKIVVSGNDVLLYDNDGHVTKTTLEEDTSLTELLKNEGITLEDLAQKDIKFSVKSPSSKWVDIANVIFNGLFLVLIGYSVVSFVKFLNSQKQGGGMGGLMSFGKSPARLILGKRPDTTFNDVAGHKEVKEEMKTVVEFLKNPEKFKKMGARIPKGILLEGPPGTGKTLMARAVAGEAHVPFFYTSGGEFEEMLVGAGAARVRDLFKKARALQPSIIFIDEIDAVAKKRGIDFRTTYSDQTLNQILSELDGLEKRDSVIVIAATNRADVLDPAIMRPGRFDWRIKFSLPDSNERLEILKYHAKNKPLESNVNLETISKMTVGFSGADLESTLNEAAILAVRRGHSKITQDDLIEGMFKVTMGPKRKSLVMTQKDLEATAYHEAGHAVVAVFLEDAPDVQNITIVPRAKSLGMTYVAPEYEKTHTTFKELLAKIAVMSGGRAAEELIYGKEYISTGASNDIDVASNIARAMVKSFGMSSKLGFINYANKEEFLLASIKKDYSEKTAQEIDQEVKSFVTNQYKVALEILKKEKVLLDKVAQALLSKESLTKEEFMEIVKKYAKNTPPKKARKNVLSMEEWVNKLKKSKK